MSIIEEHISEVVTKAVQKGISAAMRDIERTMSVSTTPPYLTKQGVMELTGWSGRTIQHMRDTDQIDYVQHGRKILYPTQALYDFLENHRIHNIKR